MRPLIKYLKEEYWTVASCCGHGRYSITVVIKYQRAGEKRVFEELFTETRIPRSRRFYKKDKHGYYYIPEVSK